MPIEPIVRIEFQALHGIMYRYRRLQYLQLIIEPTGVVHDAEVFHVWENLPDGGPRLLVLILHQHFARHLIDGLGIAQIDVGSTHADD